MIPIFCWSDPDFSFHLSGRSECATSFNGLMRRLQLFINVLRGCVSSELWQIKRKLKDCEFGGGFVQCDEL